MRHLAIGLTHRLALALLFVGIWTGCDQPADRAELTGTWRAVLASPGGELPFTLEITDTGDGKLRAVAVNGDEQVPFSSVEEQGESVTLHMEWYDSEITATQVKDDRLEGRWRRTSAGGTDSSLDFTADRGADQPRFRPIEGASAGGAQPDLSGIWAVEFVDDSGSEEAQGEFVQTGNEVTGTFLTPTGDYRFLDGTYEHGVLRLSTFDGAHAFLFEAKTAADGTMTGDFWSRDSYHATWTARRAEAGEPILPDAWQQVGLTNDEGRFAFEFPDLDGDMVSLEDSRFNGKVVLVNIFGTWCPNCNDEAPLLATWHRRFRDQGLEIVGLAYEFTGDVERDRQQVERFADRYGIDYPLLLAGTSDKGDAAATLPDLTEIIAYPTTIFIGRDGKVRRIHSGFAGPGTGRHHAELVAELESTIRDLLAES